MFRKRKTPASETQRKSEASLSASLAKEEESKEEMPSSSSSIAKPKSKPMHGGAFVTTQQQSLTSPPPSSDKTKTEEDVEKLAERKQNSAVVSLTEEQEEELLRGNKKRNQQPTNVSKKFGPSSAPAFVRATTITDYNPELCKDYNQTGYCGFGDTCIYLHDRTTYVSGNVLDQRWDAELKKSKNKPNAPPPTTADAETVCGICKREQTASTTVDFVRTKCGHLFCKACAEERFSTKTSCATCGAQTLGIFNHVVMKRN